jgi:hypothetical protein
MSAALWVLRPAAGLLVIAHAWAHTVLPLRGLFAPLDSSSARRSDTSACRCGQRHSTWRRASCRTSSWSAA